LINITGGNDLTLGEASTINQIIHDAAGDDAEIIFGAHNDPAMQGEVRVTVIATGFDRTITHDASGRSMPGILPFPAPRRAATPAPFSAPSPAARSEPRRSAAPADVPDMEIPTFIRRQMD